MVKPSDKEKRGKIQNFLSLWINENIFNSKKGDGIAYTVLYIIVPVVVTAVSLSALPEDDISIIYCYMTILISALNGIYDGWGRWNIGQKSIRNTKLFIILLSNAVVSIYCFVIIMYILIAKSTSYRHDWILLAYSIAIIVSLYDVFGCFARDMVLRVCVKNGGE